MELQVRLDVTCHSIPYAGGKILVRTREYSSLTEIFIIHYCNCNVVLNTVMVLVRLLHNSAYVTNAIVVG